MRKTCSGWLSKWPSKYYCGLTAVFRRLTDAALGNGTTLDIAYDADSLIDTLTHNLLSESGASETLSWDYGYRPSGLSYFA